VPAPIFRLACESNWAVGRARWSPRSIRCRRRRRAG